MPDPFDPSVPLRNTRYEKFVLAWAAGKSAADAYEIAGYAVDKTRANCGKLTKNDRINARREWLQRQTATESTLTQREKREFLARVVRAKLEQVPLDSDLWQEVAVTSTGTKRKLPGKLEAVRLDNDLAGEGAGARGAEAVGEVAVLLAELMGVRS